MSVPAPRPAASVLLLAGLAALASAMGIGRFAFTPMLPLMQAHGLTLPQGAWLALANYLGYLAGALWCSLRAPAPQQAARLGLLTVAATTLAMGLTDALPAWLALRFAAGAASAVVLVGIAAALPAEFAARGRAAWGGAVFAGVGLGIVGAGVLGLVAGVVALAPAFAWLLLGAASTLIAMVVWPALPGRGPAPAVDAGGSVRPLGRAGWRLVLVYGGFGFGYIVPATFLPAAARSLMPDPAVFGWVWPVFGLAAAGSTLLAVFVFGAAPPRRLWAIAQAAMAAGVLATALWVHPASLLLCALAVGGSFLVATMAGLQEARRLAGPAAPRWIASMTAAFAAGQLLGPLAVALLATPHDDGLAASSALAAAVLAAGAIALWRPAETPHPLTEGRRP